MVDTRNDGHSPGWHDDLLALWRAVDAANLGPPPMEERPCQHCSRLTRANICDRCLVYERTMRLFRDLSMSIQEENLRMHIGRRFEVHKMFGGLGLNNSGPLFGTTDDPDRVVWCFVGCCRRLAVLFYRLHPNNMPIVRGNRRFYLKSFKHHYDWAVALVEREWKTWVEEGKNKCRLEPVRLEFRTSFVCAEADLVPCLPNLQESLVRRMAAEWYQRLDDAIAALIDREGALDALLEPPAIQPEPTDIRISFPSYRRWTATNVI